jgi:ribosomal protein S21
MSRDQRDSQPLIKGSKVEVRDGNVEKALRKFKNKIQDSGLLEEVRERMEYVKPNIERTKKANSARRRWLKQVERDELEGRRPPKEGGRKRLY